MARGREREQSSFGKIESPSWPLSFSHLLPSSLTSRLLFYPILSYLISLTFSLSVPPSLISDRTSNENEIACTGCCSVILALFASSDHPFGDVSISHRWRVFRVDSDGEGSVSDDGNEETRAVESVSEGMGRAGISCFYTAFVQLFSPCSILVDSDLTFSLLLWLYL